MEVSVYRDSRINDKFTAGGNRTVNTGMEDLLIWHIMEFTGLLTLYYETNWHYNHGHLCD